MMENQGRKLVLIVVILVVISGLPLAVDWVLQDPVPDRATVTFVQADGTEVGTVATEVSTTSSEMYTGLSNHESLDRNEGMLFVHDEANQYTYTMRGMSFPIDIIFIDEELSITTIHHAYPGDSIDSYSGRAKYVVEVNVHWTTDHNISVDDRVSINWNS